MAEVFVSTRTGAQVVVFSCDHCPPHVTALKRRDDWIARIRFSFVTNTVGLWDIEPIRNAPRRRDIGALLGDVQDHLVACRERWWSVRGTTCLEGRLTTVPAAGSGRPPTFLTRREAEVRQVIAAVYDVATQRLSINFRDGSIVTMAAGAGEET